MGFPLNCRGRELNPLAPAEAQHGGPGGPHGPRGGEESREWRVVAGSGDTEGSLAPGEADA